MTLPVLVGRMVVAVQHSLPLLLEGRHPEGRYLEGRHSLCTLVVVLQVELGNRPFVELGIRLPVELDMLFSL